MPGKDKKYAVEGMRVKCSIGTTMCTLNTMGHGVTYQGKSVLNANDHIPMVNIMTFGTCINKPCVPVTPLAWRFCNEEHMIDGAPALTTDSLCNCALGGVLSIVDNSVSMGGIGAQSAKSGYVNKQNELQSQDERLDVTKTVSSVVQEEKSSYNVPRSMEELQKVAQKIKSQIGNYAVNESKWSGKIVVDNSILSDNALGQKEWNCDITLIDTVDDGVVWHEMLHSCSVSYYPPEIYSANQYIEEASVEFLKQQICLEQKIESVETYSDKVARLLILNDEFKFGTNMEFAKELFNVPLPERYQWLENKVDEKLHNMKASFNDYYDTIDFVKELKGGNKDE